LRDTFYPVSGWLVWLMVIGASTWPLHAAQAQDTLATRAPRRGSLSALVGYGSNLAFYGRVQPVPYPYLTSEVRYTSRFGLWASVVVSDLLPTGTVLDETNLLAGWEGDLTKKLDASVSYARFFFAPNSPLIKSSVNNSVESYLGYDWGYVYTRLNADFLFGPDSRDGFVQLENSRYFALKTLGKATLSAEPKLGVIAGTQNFDAVSVVQQLQRGNSIKSLGKGKTKNHQITTTTYSTRFDVLAYELQVPVSYTLGKVMGQVSYRYLVPVNVPDDDESSPSSFLTATFLVTF
jgi:hypothetical protein